MEPRGSALIAVLWLVAALSAIALTVAATVRSETQRAASSADSLKAYYLATGAIERALLYLQWGPAYKNPDGTSMYYDGGPLMHFEFPGGAANVEIIPESSKMNVNHILPEQLYNLLLALGVPGERAQKLTEAIVEWRSPVPPDIEAMESLSMGPGPTFRPRHASFVETEELLLVQGMTPELYYGTAEPDSDGHLTPRHGLKDCLSVYSSSGPFDVNTAEPAVLVAAGVPPEVVNMIVQIRAQHPFLKFEDLQALGDDAPGRQWLRIGGNSIFTIRATARPRLADGTLSDARRSVAEVVKVMDPQDSSERYNVLRWYDNEWVQ